jgi:hypothetical protein
MNNLPNIYTILEKMDFEKVSEEVEHQILFLQKVNIKDTKFNREQIVFSVVQKFYETLLDEIEK